MTPATAPKTLHIARKLVSLLGNIQITDDTDTVLYQAKGKWGWLRKPWRITQGEQEVAVLARKLWSFAPVWEVDGRNASYPSYLLRGKLWSWRRQVTVVGGPFDGAVLKGSLFDMNFELTLHGQVLARAQSELLTIRTRHSIVLLDTSPAVERLTAILMFHLLVEKGEERKLAASDPTPASSYHGG